MAKNAIYEGRREVRTFVDLDHGAGVLIKKSRETQKGSYYTIMGALLLSAFTFVAYLNHVGAEKIKFWDEIESIRVIDKYSVLCKEFDIVPDFSKRPYQTIRTLFKFRNAIAHGKSKILEETKKVDSKCDPYSCSPKTHWEEYCTIENAERAKEDITVIITEIHEKECLGAYPFISGMTVASISIK